MAKIFNEIRVYEIMENQYYIEFVYNNKKVNLLDSVLFYSNKKESYCNDKKNVFVPLSAKEFLKALNKTELKSPNSRKTSNIIKYESLPVLDSRATNIYFVPYNNLCISDLRNILQNLYKIENKNMNNFNKQLNIAILNDNNELSL